MKKIIFCVTISLLLYTLNAAKAQQFSTYLALVNKRIFFIDSLVHSFYADPAARLGHIVMHYNCLGRDTTAIWGASSDLYNEPGTSNIYQLTYNGSCDSFFTDKTFYFINNKIVFMVIRDEKSGKWQTRKKFYKDDKLIVMNGIAVTRQNRQADKDLKDGYDLLRRSK